MNNFDFNVTILCCVVVIASIYSFNYELTVFPFDGYLLGFHFVFVFLISSWIFFVALQYLLKKTKPIRISFKDYSIFSILPLICNSPILQGIGILNKQTQCAQKFNLGDETTNLLRKTKHVDQSVKGFVDDVEAQFICKWYKFISEDRNFPDETNKLLHEVFKRFLQVVIEIDHRKFLHGFSTIIFNHFKEFWRSVKRAERKEHSIEESYRFNSKCIKSSEVLKGYIYRLTSEILKQFINWELYYSLPFKLLVAVLSKTLVAHLLNFLSLPEFLNYKLVQICNQYKPKDFNFHSFSLVKISDIQQMKIKVVTNKNRINLNENEVNDKISCKFTENEESNTDKIDKVCGNEKIEVKIIDKKEVDESTIIFNSCQFQAVEPVKVYCTKPSNKTWRNSRDLLSISLGQDLLQLQKISDLDLDNQITKKNNEIYLQKEETESLTSETVPMLREFEQNTLNTMVIPVSQATITAMHRFEHFQDEASGVMEGIFDFGMAGLRKGFKLTGLQDNFSEITSKNQKQERKGEEFSKIRDRNFEESVWINPLKESPNFDGNILLEQFDYPSEISQIGKDDLLINNSSKPEYEEETDFATTIAKLRSLLQQKEYSLRTPSLSPSDSLVAPNDDLHDSNRVDGSMPSLYKLCARTATGVLQNTLNTIKTALPGTINEPIQDIRLNIDKWTFVEANSFSDDFQSRISKLISERRAFCTVDTAYEAISSLDVIDQCEPVWTSDILENDDEIDELTSSIPTTKALIDIFCVLMSDINGCLTREPIVKLMLLLFGNHCEDILNNKAEVILLSVQKCIRNLPDNYENSIIFEMKFGEIVEWCKECFPSCGSTIIGDAALKSVLEMLISSFQSKRINQHVVVQVFELCVSELILADKKCSQSCFE